MKVYFAPCGIGFGHISRCSIIAKELVSRGHEVVFSVYSGFKDAIHFLSREGYRVKECPPVSLAFREDGSLDIKFTLMKGLADLFTTIPHQVAVEVSTIVNVDPDVVVSDSRATPIIASKLLDRPIFSILNQFHVITPETRYRKLKYVTDYFSLSTVSQVWELSDRIIVPDLPPPYTVCLRNLRISKHNVEKFSIVGPILPNEINPQPKDRFLSQYGMDPDKETVYALLSGPISERLSAARLLLRLLPHLSQEYNVFMSLGTPRMDSEPLRKNGLLVFPWLPDRFSAINASDAVICLGGHQTIMECIYFGKPMLLMPTPQHSEKTFNAMRAEEIGAGIFLKRDKLTASTLKHMISLLMKEHFRRRLSELSSIARRTKAVRTITKLLEAVGN